MKIIKTFNDYSNSINEEINIFGDKWNIAKKFIDKYKKNPNHNQLNNSEEDESSVKNGILLMDAEPYDKSDFGQLKYGVYLTDYTTPEKYYYLGDLREFTKAAGPNPYVSYLLLSRIHIEEPHGLLHSIDADAEEIIQNELDKIAFLPNLMDDEITYREMIEKKFGIKIHNPIFNN